MIDEHLHRLTDNPLVLASLADREKFHTGMIAYVANHSREFMAWLLDGADREIATRGVATLTADVEDKSIDLVLRIDGRAVTGIEVKLKTDLRPHQIPKIKSRKLRPLLVSLFPPVSDSDAAARRASLGEIAANVMRAELAGVNKAECLVNLWAQQLDDLQVAADMYMNTGRSEVPRLSDGSHLAAILDRLKLRGIFEGYRYGLVADAIQKSENFNRLSISDNEIRGTWRHPSVGNSHGNGLAQVGRNLPGGGWFGLQWQQGRLKFFIERAEMRGSDRREALLTEIGMRLAKGVSNHRLLHNPSRPGRFQSIAIANWDIDEDIHTRGEQMASLCTILDEDYAKQIEQMIGESANGSTAMSSPNR